MTQRRIPVSALRVAARNLAVSLDELFGVRAHAKNKRDRRPNTSEGRLQAPREKS